MPANHPIGQGGPVPEKDKKTVGGRLCIGCGAPIVNRIGQARYCSYRCLRLHRGAARGVLASGTVGAMAELAVCNDLMQRGFDVFRAQSPACSCDLILLGGRGPVRVEVRTGSYIVNGKLKYSKPLRDRGRQDVYAVVSHTTGAIIYEPPLETVC